MYSNLVLFLVFNRSKPIHKVHMEECTEKKFDYNPIIFSGKYGTESGSITPGEKNNYILHQFYQL